MNRRTLTIVVGILLTLSLIGVGFASWVITAGDTEEVSGNIQVETVTDKRLELSNTKIVAYTQTEEGQVVEYKNFIFGKGTKGTNSWLDATEVEQEQLSATLTFNLKYKDGTQIVLSGENKNVTLSVSFDDDTQTLLDAAVTAGYIKAVPQLKVNGSNGNYSVTITFEWGKLFNNQNPFKWYNDNAVDGEYSYDAKGFAGEKGTEGITTATYGDHASEFLAKMYSHFNGQNYVIVINAEPYNNQ